MKLFAKSNKTGKIFNIVTYNHGFAYDFIKTEEENEGDNAELYKITWEDGRQFTDMYYVNDEIYKKYYCKKGV